MNSRSLVSDCFYLTPPGPQIVCWHQMLGFFQMSPTVPSWGRTSPPFDGNENHQLTLNKSKSHHHSLLSHHTPPSSTSRSIISESTCITYITTITAITIIIPRHLRESNGCRPSKEQRGPCKKLVVHQPTIIYNISTILQQSFTYT